MFSAQIPDIVRPCAEAVRALLWVVEQRLTTEPAVTEAALAHCAVDMGVMGARMCARIAATVLVQRTRVHLCFRRRAALPAALLPLLHALGLGSCVNVMFDVAPEHTPDAVVVVPQDVRGPDVSPLLEGAALAVCYGDTCAARPLQLLALAVVECCRALSFATDVLLASGAVCANREDLLAVLCVVRRQRNVGADLLDAVEGAIDELLQSTMV